MRSDPVRYFYYISDGADRPSGALCLARLLVLFVLYANPRLVIVASHSLPLSGCGLFFIPALHFFRNNLNNSQVFCILTCSSLHNDSETQHSYTGAVPFLNMKQKPELVGARITASLGFFILNIMRQK